MKPLILNNIDHFLFIMLLISRVGEVKVSDMTEGYEPI